MLSGINALREIRRIARASDIRLLVLDQIERLAEDALVLHALARQAGVERAKAAGRYKGRHPHIDAAEVRRLAQTMGMTAVAKQLGIARSSAYRLTRL